MTEINKLNTQNLNAVKQVKMNLPVAELVEEALKNNEGVLADTGAFMCDTGKFTGRSPQDRFLVKDDATANVWWGNINIPFEGAKFKSLHAKVWDYINENDKKLYVRDMYAGADVNHRLKVRVITTLASVNHFVSNMFIQPSAEELVGFEPDWVVVQVPEFEADPEVDGTRQGNFAIADFTEQCIIIGGTRYTGEIKKGIFSVLNALLPERDVLPMHCSANEGKDGDAAVFFGLSGTGKTTLSADPNRLLIGDDEHGWTESGIFNFEGGCYAKTIDLSQKKEPEIWDAIKFGATLENTRFFEGTRTVDYENVSVTQNTRTSYPLEHIENVKIPSVSTHPKNIFFLTCDAYGILPPISKLTKAQAMYHFMSGYTAQVAGTEVGITEPKPVFSACFGAPFMPLHPSKYAEMLGQKMEQFDTNIWLINTGWAAGPYGKCDRMKLRYTRAMITAALEGKLANVEFTEDSIFGVQIPNEVEGVPSEVLRPKAQWEANGIEGYEEAAKNLAEKFVANFKKFEEGTSADILAGAPKAL
ncbi:phosphoenolpyruvate carboxykinase (ATP) [Sediminitomix flava]|uniref:Phosphoenolpyruvate carboxykinase (ATP) n=1 Tax=Sediminitomix flava TaxID=379075 RepID=A0A315ZAX4_SEDFL|nr:phosphoenolpyruvate carboxykinase (ATP) [Sediminitomix flava]PWJ42203.1 phosphoenolpyruvate carboxykinase (ATP) [Sediminitomix flava]